MRISDREPIVVACAADGRYVMPLAVMLTSLVDRLDPRRALSAYQPLMIPDFLPDSLRKAIWLDCDVVIQHDLAPLWDTEVGDRYVLAAQDTIVPYASSFMGVAHYAELGIDASAKYFNAGVMIVNLALWREHDIVGRVLEYLQRYRDDVFFLEQEALNAVLAGRWGELDPRWNQNASVTGRPFFKARHLDERTYHRVVEDPWIVHFSGNIKPWTIRKENPSRTVTGLLLGAYESSRLRKVLYPAEKWFLDVLRRLTRRRLGRSASPAR